MKTGFCVMVPPEAQMAGPLDHMERGFGRAGTGFPTDKGLAEAGVVMWAVLRQATLLTPALRSGGLRSYWSKSSLRITASGGRRRCHQAGSLEDRGRESWGSRWHGHPGCSRPFFGPTFSGTESSKCGIIGFSVYGWWAAARPSRGS